VEHLSANQSGVTTWASVVGARPQFVKLAPICRAIEAYNRNGGYPQIDHRIIHTGQHYDRAVAEIFFVHMGIPEPMCNLAVGSGSHGAQLARMVERLEPALLSVRPDWVILYGDTTSTLAGALIGARLQLPLAHVEAGCRSADLNMPEEQARIVADHLSRLLLAPSQAALTNLHREGIGVKQDPRNRRAVVVGDVMHDALIQHQELAEQHADHTLERFGLESDSYYLLTLHRAENTDCAEHLCKILDAVGGLDFPVLFPVHPRTQKMMNSAGLSLNGRLRPVTPLGYLEMIAMEKHARMILTDSGGVQREAYYLGVPCLTLRDSTEWPETIELGANQIVGTDPETIRAAAQTSRKRGSWPVNMYGGGDASRAIVSELLAGCQRHDAPEAAWTVSAEAWSKPMFDGRP